MKYYTIGVTSNLEVIGDYPQVEKTKEYNFSSPDSYWNVSWNLLPSFIPNYEVRISDKAKPTNLLSALPGFYGLTIDDKFKSLLENAKLSPHRFYPIKVTHLNKKLDYHWFHFIDSVLNYVNFEKSLFEFFQKTPFRILDEIRVTSVGQLHSLKAGLNFEEGIRIKKLVLLKGFPNFDVISLWNITPLILVSEKLKEELERGGLKGFELIEYQQLVTAE